MSIAFVFCGFQILVAMPTAVLLLIQIGVGGCLCPSSSSVFLIGMPSCAFIKSAPSSDSAADDITFSIILASECIGPLYGAFFVVLLLRK